MAARTGHTGISSMRSSSTREQPTLPSRVDNAIASEEATSLRQSALRQASGFARYHRAVYRRHEWAEETERGPSVEFFVEGLVTVAA